MVFRFLVLLVFGHFSAFANPEFDSLKAVIELDTSDHNKIRTAMYLSRQIHRANPSDEDDFYYAELALELSTLQTDTLLIAECYDNLGLLYRYHSHYAKSTPLHIKALEYVKNLNVDPYFKMRFANNAGVSARYDQAFDLAVDNYLYALKIAERENDLKNIAIASNGLGNSLSHIEGKSEEALSYYLKALESESQRENTLGMAMNYLSISGYYLRKEDYTTSREYLDKLLVINTERKDQHGIAMTYEYFGHSYFEEGLNLDLAQDYYQKALGVFSEIDQQHKVAGIFIALGEVGQKRNEPATSLRYFQRAYTIAKEVHNKALLMQSSRMLSRSFEDMGDFSQALKYFKTFEAYKDSLNLIEQESTISGLRMEYDFEKKENELNLLQAEKDVQTQQFLLTEEKFKRERIVLFGLISAILVITLVIILSLRNLNLKKNLAIQQEEQKRKELQATYQNDLLQAEILATRMQMNPHFLFNCLNSIKLLIQKAQNKDAIKYLTTLSRFIRDILQTSKMPTVTLSEELELTKKYIELEENRFEEKLDLKVCLKDISEEDLQRTQVPPMILQPFVENSIWHGLLPSNRDVKRLSISIAKENDSVMISILDNGVGRQYKSVNQSNSHKSMGAAITQHRIELFNKITNSQMRLSTLDHKDNNKEPKGTEVQIQVT